MAEFRADVTAEFQAMHENSSSATAWLVRACACVEHHIHAVYSNAALMRPGPTLSLAAACLHSDSEPPVPNVDVHGEVMSRDPRMYAESREGKPRQ